MVFTCGQHMGHMGRMGRMDHMERNCGAQVEDNKMQGIPSVQGVQPGPDKGGPARGGPEGAVGVARGTVHLCAVWEGHRAPVRAVWVWRGAPCTCAHCVGVARGTVHLCALCGSQARSPQDRCQVRMQAHASVGRGSCARRSYDLGEPRPCAMRSLCAPSMCSIRVLHPCAPPRAAPPSSIPNQGDACPSSLRATCRVSRQPAEAC